MSADSYLSFDFGKRLISGFFLSATRVLQHSAIPELLEAVRFLCDHITSSLDSVWDSVCKIEWEYLNTEGHEAIWREFQEFVGSRNEKLRLRFEKVTELRRLQPIQGTCRFCVAAVPRGLSIYIPWVEQEDVGFSWLCRDLPCVYCGTVRSYFLWRQHNTGFQHLYVDHVRVSADEDEDEEEDEEGEVEDDEEW